MTRIGAGRTTLDGVAAKAGVSKATASKVLNGRGGVSSATRERVFAAMKELGYAPSTGRTIGGAPSMVTVVFDAAETIYAARILSGAVALGMEMDVDVVVTSPASRSPHQPLTAEWLGRIADKGHLGIIVVTAEVTPEVARAAAKAGLGLVAVDPVSPSDADDGLVSVSATNWTGGYQATAHLLDLGHRRIGFAGGPPESQPARHRYHGHLAALEAADIEARPELLLRRGFDRDDGRQMAQDLLDLKQPPTGIVAGCDASALGVIAVARERNLRLPEDLSVVGFDDTYAADLASPPLTTIRQPLWEMGRLAIRTVLSLASGEVRETHHLELATTLVVRKSTAPPPSATTPNGALQPPHGTAKRRPVNRAR